MHGIALATGPVAVILMGILFGIFYNQRAIDKLEARMEAVSRLSAIRLTSFRAT